jgi:hypothetical protein
MPPKRYSSDPARPRLHPAVEDCVSETKQARGLQVPTRADGILVGAACVPPFWSPVQYLVPTLRSRRRSSETGNDGRLVDTAPRIATGTTSTVPDEGVHAHPSPRGNHRPNRVYVHVDHLNAADGYRSLSLSFPTFRAFCACNFHAACCTNRTVSEFT